MSDFLSINPAPDMIVIDGKKYPVYGISMEGFGSLVLRFPNLATDLQAEMSSDGAQLFFAIVKVAGPAMGAILAAGLGYAGNDEAENKAAKLGLSVQAKLLRMIVDRTMPEGVGPFVAELTALMERLAPPPPKKPRFKVLQRESRPSSPADMPDLMSGG